MKKLLIAICILILLATTAGARGLMMVGGGIEAVAGGYATPALVGSANSGYDTGPVTKADATNGNLLVVWVSGNSTVTTTTLSGGGVSSWTALTEYITGTSAYGRLFWGMTTGGTVSITITNPPGDCGWSIHEYTNIAASSAFDQEAGGEVGVFSSGWSSGNTSNTTVDTELLVGVWANENGDPGATWGDGWNSRTAETGHAHGTGDRVVTSTGAYAASGTATAASNGIAVIATFKAKAN